jgi:hypothetical protein
MKIIDKEWSNFCDSRFEYATRAFITLTNHRADSFCSVTEDLHRWQRLQGKASRIVRV